MDELTKTSAETEVRSEIKNIVAQEFNPEQDIARGQKSAKALMKLIKLTKPLRLGGKDYLFYEHWICIARFFGATVGIEWTKKTETGWEARAIVYQNGIIIGSAEASCNNDEYNWKNKPDFQLKSMSQTRACAKALRNIFGYIPVLVGIQATPAEEMQDIQLEAEKPALGQNFAPQATLQTASYKPTERQTDFIKRLCKQKGITQAMLVKMAENKDPSQLIDFLLKYQPPTPGQQEIETIANPKRHDEMEEIPFVEDDYVAL